MSKQLISLIALITLTAGCGTIGNGSLAHETRAVSDFSAAEAHNGVSLFLAVDTSAPGKVELEVSAESNLLNLIQTRVSRDVLDVDVSGVTTAHFDMEVAGTVAELQEAAAFDGAHIDVLGISGSTFDIQAYDGAVAEVSGMTEHLTLVADDGGQARAGLLTANTASVFVDNGASGVVCATGKVTGSVNNGGKLVVECGGDSSGVDTDNGGSVRSR